MKGKEKIEEVFIKHDRQIIHNISSIEAHFKKL